MADANFNLACNNIEQSLEHVLKFIIEYYVGKYIPSHDLAPNLRILRELKMKDENKINEILDSIDLYATEVSSWSTESRYTKSFIATNNLYEKVSNDTKKLLDFCIPILELSRKK